MLSPGNMFGDLPVHHVDLPDHADKRPDDRPCEPRARRAADPAGAANACGLLLDSAPVPDV